MSPVEQSITPIIAIMKLTQRVLFIFSFKIRKANTAVITGNESVRIAALLASEYCVPHVMNTCAIKAPHKASGTNTRRSFKTFFPFLKSFQTNGIKKIVDKSIGPQTVKYGPA
jgi:hypothetical protein